MSDGSTQLEKDSRELADMARARMPGVKPQSGESRTGFSTGAMRAVQQLRTYEKLMQTVQQCIELARWERVYVELSQRHQEDTRLDKGSLVLTVTWVNDAAGERLYAVWEANTGSDGLGRVTGPQITWHGGYCVPIAGEELRMLFSVLDGWKVRR